MSTVRLERSFKGLKSKRTYDDNLPILYPTRNTIKADLWLKVTNNDIPKARIPLHRDHMRENFSYFEGMFRDHSNFREADTDEVTFECPYDAQIVCDYFATCYEPNMMIDDTRYLAYYWIADFLNDSVALPACREYFTNNISDNNVFKIMNLTDYFDEDCLGHFKSNGLSVKRLYDNTDLIQKLPGCRVIWFMEELLKLTTSEVRHEFLGLWLETNKEDSDVEIILKMNFSTVCIDKQLGLYRSLRNMIPSGMDDKVFEHIFKVNKHSQKYMYSAPEQNKATVLRLSNPILSGILDNKLQMEEGVKRWYGKSFSFKNSDGYRVPYERISNQGLGHVVEERLHFYNYHKERGPVELHRLGVFMRYLISYYDQRKFDVEEQIIKGIREYIHYWIEADSWFNFPHLWQNTAIFVAPLFNRKEHCPDLPTFSVAEYNEICELCCLKKTCNHKSMLAVHLMAKLIGNGFLRNEWQCLRFWRDTKRSWAQGYNESTKADFIKAAETCNLRHLSLFEEVEKQALPFLEIADKTGDRATQFLKLTKSTYDPQSAEPRTVCAVFQHIATHILTKFVEGKIDQTKLEDDFSDCATSFRAVFEKHEPVNTCLELELIYAVEVTYCELRSRKRPSEIVTVMYRLLDSMAFRSETLLKLWYQPRVGEHIFRGGDQKTRDEMQVEVKWFMEELMDFAYSKRKQR